ncbi:MAG: hypothetical protein AB7G15_14330 [Alphaproteobacteria bacterium]
MKAWLGAGLAVLLFAAAPLPAPAQTKPEDKIKALQKMLPGEIDLKYGSVAAGATPGSVIVKDVVITQKPNPAQPKAEQPIKIAEIEMREYDEKNAKPQFADISLRGVQVPLDDSDQKDLKAMGYTQVVLDFTYKFRFDQPNTTLTISEIRIDGIEMGSLSIQLTLGGIPSIDWSDEKSMQMMMGATVVSATIKYKDMSLIERALKKDAADKKITVDALRAQKLAEVKAEEDKEPSAAGKAAYAAFRKFMEKPGTITISAKPKQPVPIMGVMAVKDFGQAAELFGLTVAAE